MTSTPLGVLTIRALEAGDAIDATVEELLADDPHASVRQIHGVDTDGGVVASTGEECVPTAGERVGPGYTVAGNMLVGEDVLGAMADRFETTVGRPLDERLLAALEAGTNAGGDKRGEHPQSAALCVFDSEEPHLAHDLRVDEHETAVAELRRIHDLASTVGSEWGEEYPRADLQRHPK